MILKNKIKKIIDAIKDTDINEIEISSFWGAQRIKMKKNASGSFVNQNSPSADSLNVSDNVPINEAYQNDKDIPVKEAVEEQIQNDNMSFTTIKAPLVGTFYLSPKPGDPSFVDVGSVVNVGDTICIIEAMKIFNEIDCEFNGIIKEILIEDGQPVEFDQPLFKIEEK